MSDAAKGSARVGSVQTKLAAAGFRTARISASGQRRGSRREERGLDGDLIALAPEHSGIPHMLIEVGGLKKSCSQSLLEMTEHGPLPPGFIPVVVRLIDSRRKRWRWHLDSLEAYDTLDELLDAVRSEAA